MSQSASGAQLASDYISTRAALDTLLVKSPADYFWRYVPELKSYLSKRLDRGEIDDVVQDVMLKLHTRDARWDIRFPKRYFYQVVRSTLVDLYRRNRSRCVHHHCELSPETHPRDDLSPIRILQAREEVRAARAALALLPQRTREIFLAVRLEGQSLKQVAASHGISTSAVEKHITRALNTLSVQLHDRDDPITDGWGAGARVRRLAMSAAPALS
ncbi:RNA polymerase sigma factor [Caulobacter sp. 602-1]|uniref:RNA polymerase sigma factor n=1 Tax=Caulobacter sp. 602-1 TaxID=2492472 RepID=UPI000F6435D2|nr:RNA polymerase sigma factor [Caulobacter sp. 602-1]RRN63564.1 RNA polymerase sigma factor [Caulobacter sp. 602-1]